MLGANQSAVGQGNGKSRHYNLSFVCIQNIYRLCQDRDEKQNETEYNNTQMYIDSPQFVRRKVLQSGAPKQYNYGDERALLSKFVASKLNSSDSNGQILQRFRREAEEYKQNLRKHRHQPTQIISNVRHNSDSFDKHNSHNSSHVVNNPHKQQKSQKIEVISIPQIQQIAVVQNKFQAKDYIEQYKNRERQLFKINKLSELLLKREKELHIRDKEIKKKDKLLAKNRQQMKEMSKIIHTFEQQEQLNRIENLLGNISHEMHHKKNVLDSYKNKNINVHKNQFQLKARQSNVHFKDSIQEMVDKSNTNKLSNDRLKEYEQYSKRRDNKREFVKSTKFTNALANEESNRRINRLSENKSQRISQQRNKVHFATPFQQTKRNIEPIVQYSKQSPNLLKKSKVQKVQKIYV